MAPDVSRREGKTTPCSVDGPRAGGDSNVRMSGCDHDGGRLRSELGVDVVPELRLAHDWNGVGVAGYRDGAAAVKSVAPPEDLETILHGVQVYAARDDVEHIRYFHEIDIRAIASADMEPDCDNGAYGDRA
jgi:hypothetical protein